jgi:hypothetical protein
LLPLPPPATLPGVLADGTNPPTVTPDRVQRGADKKRRTPLALWIVPVVLAAIAVVILLLLRGGDVPILGGEDEEAPPFDFILKGATAVPTVADVDQTTLDASAEEVGREITPTIDDLYTNAFLDPSNWRHDDYDEAFEAFASEAVPTAEQSLETLTLGANAGSVFERVEPGKGTLTYEVLFDPEAAPNTTVVTVVFRATAEQKNGTFLAIVSRGQFFLEDDGGWHITAFDVTRSDHETQPPSPSVSSSPSA